jgi:prepilin-type N-terminal cleavage/methylation domain-containing protein
MRLRQSISAGGNRFGFTLFEVVIALTLSLLLLAAVYGSIRLQYRVSTAGREQMERAQISRAILRLIESDVRSIVWQVQKPPEAAGSDESSTSVTDDGSSDEGSADSTSSSEPATDDSTALLSSDDAFVSGSSGIFGDSQSLVLHINRPSRERVYSTTFEDEAAAAGRSDLVSVSYFIADGSAGGLSAEVASQAGGGSSVLGGVVGLARVEEDRMSLEMSAGSTTGTSATGAAKVIAPEVVAIEFAYWDGLEWLTSWDSATSGTLPSAIGVTLSIDTETEVEDRTLAGRLSQSVATGQAADTGEPVQVRYVIALPLAEPYVSEASI